LIASDFVDKDLAAAMACCWLPGDAESRDHRLVPSWKPPLAGSVHETMLLRVWWLTTLLLAALGLVMGGAHLLELPVRAQYDPEFYMRVTSTLYRYFGLVGGPLQVLAVLSSIGLVWFTRGRAAFRSNAAGTVCLALSIVLWFLIVQPVNAAWAEALRIGPAEAVEAYAQLGSRWEAGHVVAFAVWLIGVVVLVHGVLREARFE
jgi:hypothetical protein